VIEGKNDNKNKKYKQGVKGIAQLHPYIININKNIEQQTYDKN